MKIYNKRKILFLLRKNYSYGYNHSAPKSGLLNSASMTAAELERKFNVATKVEIVVDGNSVDRELAIYKPTHCILEALWVTPTKLRELAGLYPRMNFVIRIHSEVPFLTNEGIAIEWIKEYVKIKNVTIAFNSQETEYDFKQVMGGKFDFLPNLYEKFIPKIVIGSDYSKSINLASFGAIRPLKNQLVQAFAAIAFAEKMGKKLRFHINSSRVEQGGNSTLKNIRALFQDSRHELVEHEWMERAAFLKLIRRMDIGMQLSFTESFNIVTADFIAQGIPIVVSDTITWMPNDSKTATDNIKEIVNKLYSIERNKTLYILEQALALKDYSKKALNEWARYLNIG